MGITWSVPRPATSTPLAVAVSVLALALAGCASGPRAPAGGGIRDASGAASSDRDGPEAHPPPDLSQVPDAEPRIETVRPGGANKPYQALGRDYVPLTGDRPFTERGLASWYGRKFQGRPTASGERYDMYAMTAAHPTLPIPSYARIRNPANGREVVVRINDRGPFHSGRIVDLSYTAALKLDVLRGVAPVELERITDEDVRTGAWRRGGTEARVAAISTPTPASTPPATPMNRPAWPPIVAPPAAAGAVFRSVAAPPGTIETAESSTTPTASTPSPVDAASSTPLAPPSAGFYVQLGAFRERDGAELFQRRVVADADWLQPLLAVFGNNAFYRLQAGPYPNRGDAARAAERMRVDLQLVPLIVERR